MKRKSTVIIPNDTIAKNEIKEKVHKLNFSMRPIIEDRENKRLKLLKQRIRLSFESSKKNVRNHQNNV
jgi:hypothetical protein